MKLFEITLGSNRHFIVAKNEEEAFERRAEVDHSYDYLPVQVSELKIEGYNIHAKKKEEKQEEHSESSPEEPTGEQLQQVNEPKDDALIQPKSNKQKQNKKSNK